MKDAKTAYAAIRTDANGDGARYVMEITKKPPSPPVDHVGSIVEALEEHEARVFSNLARMKPVGAYVTEEEARLLLENFGSAIDLRGKK